MIPTLIRLDPAVSTFRYSIPISIAAGMVCAALASRVVGDGGSVLALDGSEGLLSTYLQMWFLVFLFGIGARFNARCSQLSLSLPLTPRELWLARMLSILLAVLVPLVVMTALASAHGAIRPRNAIVDPHVWRLGALAAAGLVFLYTIVLAPSPTLYALRGTRRYIAYVALSAIAVLAITLLAPRSVWVMLAFLAVSAAAAIRTYLSLPSTFTVAPRALAKAPEGPRPEDIGASAVASDRTYGGVSGRSPAWLLHLTVFRLLVNHPISWIMLPFAVLYGMWMPERYYQGREILPYFMIVFVWLTALVFQAIIRMNKLAPLPISRRLLFAYGVAPTVLAFALGLGATGLRVSVKNIKPGMVRYQGAVAVPVEFWEIAGEEGPQAVEAPWGESYVPRARRILKGLNTYVYNPYEHGAESSYKFVQFQLLRAVEAVNAVPIDNGMMRSEPDQMFREQVDSCCFTARGSEWRGSPRRSKCVATGSIIGGVLLALLYSLGLRQFRAVPRAGLYSFFLQLAFMPILVVMGAILLADAAGAADFHSAMAVPQILVRRLADAIPLGPAYLWGLAAATLVAGYFVVLSRFKRIDLHDKCCKKKSFGDY